MHLKDFPVQGEFDGIKTALDRNSYVNVIMIHGMGGFSADDPNTMKNRIANSLNLYKVGPACTRKITEAHCGVLHYYGSLKREDYRDFCTGATIHFYTIYWEDAAKYEKEKLKIMDEYYAKDRVGLINNVKKNVINNNLADTVLYLSAFRSEIEYPIIQSIRWIDEDTRDALQIENIIIGYSLGSHIIIDSLEVMENDEDSTNQAIAKKFVNDITAIFFLSNSFPILELASHQPKGKYSYQDHKICSLTPENPLNIPTPCCWDWHSSSVGRFIYEKRLSSPNFQIVAFNDPNDLFSYHATGYGVPNDNECLEAFLNEDVRNVRYSIFGFINPISAHTGYGSNGKVISLISYGLHPCYFYDISK